MALSIVILAAGQGTRMNSEQPKVLQPLAGRALLAHVIETARALDADAINVVYGYGGDAVRNAFADEDLTWTLQAQQLGTGHAVAQALPAVPADHQVLVLCGDAPLLAVETLAILCDVVTPDSFGLLTAKLADPSGYGRIVRDADGNLTGIVEESDATDEQCAIDEINTGVMLMPAGWLARVLAELEPDNAQGEYYLTDVIASAVAEQLPIVTVEAPDANEVLEDSTIARSSAAAERVVQGRYAQRLLDPRRDACGPVANRAAR